MKVNDDDLPSELHLYVESPVYDTHRRIKYVTFVPYTSCRPHKGTDRQMALALVRHIQRGTPVGYQLRDPRTGNILRTVTGYWTQQLHQQDSAG